MNSLAKVYISRFPRHSCEIRLPRLMTPDSFGGSGEWLTLEGGFGHFLFKEEIDRC